MSRNLPQLNTTGQIIADFQASTTTQNILTGLRIEFVTENLTGLTQVNGALICFKNAYTLNVIVVSASTVRRYDG